MARRMRYADTGRFDTIGEAPDDIIIDTRPHPKQVSKFHEVVRDMDSAGHQRTGRTLAYAEFCARQHGDPNEYLRWQKWQRGRGDRPMPYPGSVRSESDEGVTVQEVAPD